MKKWMKEQSQSFTRHQVLNGFLSCSQFVPHVLDTFLNMFSIALYFIPYALPNVVLLSPL
jgi:hypothetical protein